MCHRKVNDFKERGSVGDRPNRGLKRIKRSIENITASEESV